MKLGNLEYKELLLALQGTGCVMGSVLELPDVKARRWVLRHDIDNDLQAALRMARIEADMGVKSVYYMLDFDSGINEADMYFYKQESVAVYKEIVSLGHEIGWHNNAVSNFLRFGGERSLSECVRQPIDYLRALGIDVLSTASHGDRLCHQLGYVNYEIWDEFEKRSDVAFDRFKLSDYGLRTEAYLMPRTHYLSDSGGVFNYSDALAYIKAWGSSGTGDLQVLVHSQWWG